MGDPAAVARAAEERVVRAPEDVRAWCDYLAARPDAPRLARFAVYERALHHLPGSYKLWAAYLLERVRDTRGRPAGHASWARTERVFERALLYMHKMPRIWLDFVAFLEGRGLVTRTRQTLDRALRALPVTQHERVWAVYVPFVEKHAASVWQLGAHVFPRYLQFAPRERERYVDFLCKAGKHGLAMEQLCGIVQDRGFVSARGATAHELFMRLCKLMVEYPSEAQALGSNRLDVEALVRAGLARFSDETGRLWCLLAEFYIRLGKFERADAVYEDALRAVGTVRDFSTIFDAYTQYHEGMINAKIDLFGDEDDAEEGEGAEDANGAEGKRAQGEAADQYFYDVNAEAEDRINDVDLRLAQMERLIEQRPFMLNAVMLRQNPHNCEEWHNLAALHRERGDTAAALRALEEALGKVSPALAVGSPASLWIALANEHERAGNLKEARQVLERGVKSPFRDAKDLVELYCEFAETELRARNYRAALQVVERALTPVSERKVLEEFNIRKQLRDKGVSGREAAAAAATAATAAQAAAEPQEDDTEGSREGAAREKIRLQRQVYKSTRLWNLYVDLEESLGTLKTARAAYDKMLDLKVGTPATVLNYAAMLEENEYFEESFKVLERGVSLFDWPHVGDIWLQYLTAFVRRYKGSKMFRARELFEQALEGAPPDQAKPLYLALATLEEEHGDPRKALLALAALCKAAPPEDKAQLFLLYAAKAEALFGLSRAREVFEAAVEELEDPAQVRELCLRFAEKERKLGEIDRARGILRHGAQFADPRTIVSYWVKWHEFEVAHGNEDTFREMLRVKRTVSVQFRNTNYSLVDGESSDSVSREASAVGTKRGAAELAPPTQVEESAKAARVSEEGATAGVAGAAPALVAAEETVVSGLEEQSVPAAVFGGAVRSAQQGQD